MKGSIKRAIVGLTVTAVIGCADSATSPDGARNVVPSDKPSLDYDGPSRFGGHRSTSFTLTQSGGTFAIGDLYTLTVPANAVCVRESTYGPGTWDTPCKTLSAGRSIHVTATYSFNRTGPVVEFQPDLRFAPGAEVTLATRLYAPILTAFRSYFEAQPSALRTFGIYYTPDAGETQVADAASDASLVTHINLRTGVVWRRVKHFSGYNVASGLACEPSPDDPDCVPGPAPIVDNR